MKQFFRNNYQLLLILLISIFFRFYKLAEFFTFNFDEEYQALLAWEQVKNPHPIWVGVSASNINYYLGPGFTYLNAILFFITKDPLILAFFGSLLGVITTISLYYICKEVFNRSVAIYASLFYSASLLIAYFDRRFWNDTPIMLISLWIYYALTKAQNNSRWLIFAVFLMGLSLHIHLSLLAFWPVILIYLIINFRKIKFATYLLSIISFLVITFPLLIFDLNHNFDNLLMPFRYAQKLLTFSRGEGNIQSGFSQLANTLTRLWYLNPYTNVQDEIQLGIHGVITNTNPATTLFSLVIIFYLFRISFIEKKYWLLSTSITSFLAVYLFYPGGVVAYFLLGFFALFSIAVGLFFSRLPRVAAALLILIFLLVNFSSLITSKQEQFGLKTRKRLVQKIMTTVQDSSFYLETQTLDKRKYHSAGGWRYLFKAYGKTPSQSHADDFFGWIYSDEIAKEKPKLRVIISEYPTKVKEKIISKYNEGVYYGYVIEN